MAARLRRFLARLGAASAEAFARGGVAELERAVAASEAELGKLLDEEYRRVLLTFGRRVLDAAGKAAPQLRQTKAPEPRFAEAVLRFLRQQGLRQVTRLSGTTRAQLRSIIADGEREGLGVVEIARRIQDRFTETSAVRAQTIARTETHNAATYATDQAAESTGLKFEREWVAAEDNRTRPDHGEADG
jgi:SPP1 gp7 family putative phage head morphogenesis protein